MAFVLMMAVETLVFRSLLLRGEVRFRKRLVVFWLNDAVHLVLSIQFVHLRFLFDQV